MIGKQKIIPNKRMILKRDYSAKLSISSKDKLVNF